MLGHWLQSREHSVCHLAMTLSMQFKLANAKYDYRVLISIPTGGAMLTKDGGTIYAICMGSILLAAFACFLLGRWIILERSWTVSVCI